MCSLYFSLFGCFWRILYSNDLYILASHSCFLSTTKSWFSPPMHHTFASTLQKLLWKWQQIISIMSNLSIFYSYFLVLSVLFENSRDSVFSKVVYLWFPWYYSLLGLTLFCYYLPYEYICFSSACSLNVSVPQGFFLSSFFLHTAFLSICSFQVTSFELMIWTLTYVLMTTKASSRALPSALSFRFNQPNHFYVYALGYLQSPLVQYRQTWIWHLLPTTLLLWIHSSFAPNNIFGNNVFWDNISSVLSRNHFLPVDPAEWTVGHWFPLLHSWLDNGTERCSHSECSWVPEMVEHKGKMHVLLPLRFMGSLESRTTTPVKLRPLVTPLLRGGSPFFSTIDKGLSLLQPE